jgi:hypothetical protein
MEIEYTLTMKELGASLQPLKEKHGKSTRIVIPSNAIWILVLVLLVAWYLTNGRRTFAEHAVSFWMGLLAGGGSVALLLFWSKRMLLLSNARFETDERNRWLFELQRMRLAPEELTITSAVQRISLAWAGVCQIDATEIGVIFWTTTRSAHIVPRRAFRDEAHFNEFVSLAREYQEGRGQPTPRPTGIITSLPPEATAITRPNAP